MAVFRDLWSYVASAERVLLLSLVVLFCLTVHETWFSIPYPTELPLAGEPHGKRIFSLRTRRRYYLDCAALYREAYQQFSKKGRTVLLPGIGTRCDILLPQSSMQWVLSRSETDLNHPEATIDLLKLQFSLGDMRYKTDPWPGMLVKTGINPVVEKVCVDVTDELARAIDDAFGIRSDGWTETLVLPTMRKVAAQAASRFTVGVPLCRNADYLSDCLRFADGIMVNAALTSISPEILRPLLGRVFTWHTHRCIVKIRNHISDLYHQKLESSKGKENRKAVSGETTDFLQMMIDYAQSERPNEVHDLEVITRRLCFANFASMHQTGLLFANILLNIVASDAEFGTISALRNEISWVLGDSKAHHQTAADAASPMDPEATSTSTATQRKKLTKQQVARLVKLDSVARETLRLHSNASRGVFRKVVNEGVKTEDGVLLPKGSYISFFAYPAQTDPDVFDEPLKFDPFRFSRPREEASASSATTRSSGSITTGTTSFTSTSSQHLAFGHGLHSCPGRFLVDFEVKAMVAYVLGNYDLEFPESYAGQRPPNRWIAEACLPPADAKIRVQRRAL